MQLVTVTNKMKTVVPKLMNGQLNTMIQHKITQQVHILVWPDLVVSIRVVCDNFIMI